MQIINRFSNNQTLLRTFYLLMRNFIANFVRILGIIKDFARNRVNKLWDVPLLKSIICGVKSCNPTPLYKFHYSAFVY